MSFKCVVLVAVFSLLVAVSSSSMVPYTLMSMEDDDSAIHTAPITKRVTMYDDATRGLGVRGNVRNHFGETTDDSSEYGYMGYDTMNRQPLGYNLRDRSGERTMDLSGRRTLYLNRHDTGDDISGYERPVLNERPGRFGLGTYNSMESGVVVYDSTSGRPLMRNVHGGYERKATDSTEGGDSWGLLHQRNDPFVSKQILHSNDQTGRRTTVMVNKVSRDGTPRTILRESYQPLEADSLEYQNHIFKSV